MFDGYHDSTPMSFNDASYKKSQSGGKWMYGGQVYGAGVHPGHGTAPQQFWPGKPVMGVPGIVSVGKCSCAECHGAEEAGPYHGTRAWPQGKPHWGAMDAQSHSHNAEAEDKPPFYRPYHPGVIKTADMLHLDVGKQRKEEIVTTSSGQELLLLGQQHEKHDSGFCLPDVSGQSYGKPVPSSRVPSLVAPKETVPHIPYIDPVAEEAKKLRAKQKDCELEYQGYGYGSTQRLQYPERPTAEYFRNQYCDGMKKNGASYPTQGKAWEGAHYSKVASAGTYYPKDCKVPEKEGGERYDYCQRPAVTYPGEAVPRYPTAAFPYPYQNCRRPEVAYPRYPPNYYEYHQAMQRNAGLYAARQYKPAAAPPACGMDRPKLAYDGSCQPLNPQPYYSAPAPTIQPTPSHHYTPESKPSDFSRPRPLEAYPMKQRSPETKISPLRLMRKKKPAAAPEEPAPTPVLDVRRFLATWADEEEEHVSQPQIVVLDCQNIDLEQAELLRLYEHASIRTVDLNGGLVGLGQESAGLAMPDVTEEKAPPTKASRKCWPDERKEPPEVAAVESNSVSSAEQTNSPPSPPAPPQPQTDSMDDSQSSDMPVLADLPTSEYRNNKFLDLSTLPTPGVISFPRLPDKPAEVETKKLEEELTKTEVLQNIVEEMCKPAGDERKEDGCDFDEILKGISEMNVRAPNHHEKKEEATKKGKRVHRKVESEATSVIVAKPRVQFAVKKTHDLKMSFKVLSSAGSGRKARSANWKKRWLRNRRREEQPPGDFEVLESVDSAKIKLTFKRQRIPTRKDSEADNAEERVQNGEERSEGGEETEEDSDKAEDVEDDDEEEMERDETVPEREEAEDGEELEEKTSGGVSDDGEDRCEVPEEDPVVENTAGGGFDLFNESITVEGSLMLAEFNDEEQLEDGKDEKDPLDLSAMEEKRVECEPELDDDLQDTCQLPMAQVEGEVPSTASNDISHRPSDDGGTQEESKAKLDKDLQEICQVPSSATQNVIVCTPDDEEMLKAGEPNSDGDLREIRQPPMRFVEGEEASTASLQHASVDQSGNEEDRKEHEPNLQDMCLVEEQPTSVSSNGVTVEPSGIAQKPEEKEPKLDENLQNTCVQAPPMSLVDGEEACSTSSHGSTVRSSNYEVTPEEHASKLEDNLGEVCQLPVVEDKETASVSSHDARVSSPGSKDKAEVYEPRLNEPVQEMCQLPMIEGENTGSVSSHDARIRSPGCEEKAQEYEPRLDEDVQGMCQLPMIQDEETASVSSHDARIRSPGSKDKAEDYEPRLDEDVQGMCQLLMIQDEETASVSSHNARVKSLGCDEKAEENERRLDEDVQEMCQLPVVEDTGSVSSHDARVRSPDSEDKAEECEPRLDKDVQELYQLPMVEDEETGSVSSHDARIRSPDSEDKAEEYEPRLDKDVQELYQLPMVDNEETGSVSSQDDRVRSPDCEDNAEEYEPSLDDGVQELYQLRMIEDEETASVSSRDAKVRPHGCDEKAEENERRLDEGVQELYQLRMVEDEETGSVSSEDTRVRSPGCEEKAGEYDSRLDDDVQELYQLRMLEDEETGSVSSHDARGRSPGCESNAEVALQGLCKPPITRMESDDTVCREDKSYESTSKSGHHLQEVPEEISSVSRPSNTKTKPDEYEPTLEENLQEMGHLPMSLEQEETLEMSHQPIVEGGGTQDATVRSPVGEHKPEYYEPKSGEDLQEVCQLVEETTGAASHDVGVRPSDYEQLLEILEGNSAEEDDEPWESGPITAVEEFTAEGDKEGAEKVRQASDEKEACLDEVEAKLAAMEETVDSPEREEAPEEKGNKDGESNVTVEENCGDNLRILESLNRDNIECMSGDTESREATTTAEPGPKLADGTDSEADKENAQFILDLLDSSLEPQAAKLAPEVELPAIADAEKPERKKPRTKKRKNGVRLSKVVVLKAVHEGKSRAEDRSSGKGDLPCEAAAARGEMDRSWCRTPWRLYRSTSCSPHRRPASPRPARSGSVPRDNLAALDIPVADIPLPMGAAPQSSCFDLALIRRRRRNVPPSPSLSEISSRSLPSSCSSPFDLSGIQDFRNPSPPISPAKSKRPDLLRHPKVELLRGSELRNPSPPSCKFSSESSTPPSVVSKTDLDDESSPKASGGSSPVGAEPDSPLSLSRLVTSPEKVPPTACSSPLQEDTPDAPTTPFTEVEEAVATEELCLSAMDEAEEEKVSDDDKFRDVMQSCLDNAKKFLNVGHLSLFPSSVEDLLAMDEGEGAASQRFSKDVLLASCEDPPSDELVLEGASIDMTMEFIPSFETDTVNELCPEILPVDNWPYLEEEVPSSPSKEKQEELDLISTSPDRRLHLDVTDSLFRRLRNLPDSLSVIPAYLSDGSFPRGAAERLTRSKSRRLSVNILDEARLAAAAHRKSRRRKTIDGVFMVKEEEDSLKCSLDLERLRDALRLRGRSECDKVCDSSSSLDAPSPPKTQRASHDHAEGVERRYSKDSGNGGSDSSRSKLRKSSDESDAYSPLSQSSGDDAEPSKERCPQKPPLTGGYMSPLWQPKVVLYRISTAMCECDGGDTAHDKSQAESPPFKEPRLAPEIYVKPDAQSNDRDSHGKKRSSKVMEGSLSDGSNGSIRKRKKPRFRNLHTKRKCVEGSRDSDRLALSDEDEEEDEELAPRGALVSDTASSRIPKLQNSTKERDVSLSDVPETPACENAVKPISNIGDIKTKYDDQSRSDTKKRTKSSSKSAGDRQGNCHDPKNLVHKTSARDEDTRRKLKADKPVTESGEKHARSRQARSEDKSKSRKGSHDEASQKSEKRAPRKDGEALTASVVHRRNSGTIIPEAGGRERETKPKKCDVESERSAGRHQGRSERSEKPERSSRPERDHKKREDGRRRSTEEWQCGVCSFRDLTQRSSHIQTHSFHCQSCHLAFKSERDFTSHLTEHHRDIRNQHHCLLCELSFDSEEEYVDHVGCREHCHLEAVERNTINTLLAVLTGHTCPVLGPVQAKQEWLPSQPGTVHFYHQATPLSLALQYLTKRHDSPSYSGDPP